MEWKSEVAGLAASVKQGKEGLTTARDKGKKGERERKQIK